MTTAFSEIGSIRTVCRSEGGGAILLKLMTTDVFHIIEMFRLHLEQSQKA